MIDEFVSAISPQPVNGSPKNLKLKLSEYISTNIFIFMMICPRMLTQEVKTRTVIHFIKDARCWRLRARACTDHHENKYAG